MAKKSRKAKTKSANAKRPKRAVKAKSASRAKPKAVGKTMLHEARFPNESAAYRRARNTVLQAEIELRRQIERVAAARRALPMGGVVPADYEFDDQTALGLARKVKLSELFGNKDTLVVYSFMFGPNMKAACPSCTSILDGLNGSASHIGQRVSFAVVAKSSIARIRAFARERGWRTLRLLSSEGNSYNRDYYGENETGSQTPMLNVFVRDKGVIRHAYATELMFAAPDKGQDPRHVDAIWPVWNVFDYTPGGRGTDWRPSLKYESS